MKTQLVALLLLLGVLAPFSALAAAETSNTFSTTLVAASTQYWSVVDASQTGLDLTGDFSISSWVKFTTLPTSGTGYWIVGKYGFDNNTRQYTFGIKNIAGTYNIAVLTSTNGTAFTEADIPWTTPVPATGTWYQIGVSKTSTTATIYINGSSIGSGTVNSTQVNSTAPFTVGIIKGTTTDSPLNGEVDSVLIYSAAIGGTGMSALNTTPCNPSTTSLVSWWRFNNNGTDSQGSNTLTNNNTATFTSDVAYSCGSVSKFTPWQFWAF